jgi:hypothetical protein
MSSAAVSPPVVGPSDPAVRAAFTRAALHEALAADPAVAAHLRAALPASTIAAVLDAGRNAWLPVAIDMDVTEAIAAALGPDRSAAFWRKSLVETLESPLLKPIVDGVVGLFGLAPESLLRWAPRAWLTIYRNCGTMTVLERGIRSGRLGFDDITPALVRSGAFIEALRASFEAVFTLCRVYGEVRVESCDLAARQAVYAFSWTPRPRRRG